MPKTTKPDTIVLIHGLWMTPRSWEHWIPRYESRGFKVLAPAYPGFEVEVEALREDPTPIEQATIDGVATTSASSAGWASRRSSSATRLAARSRSSCWTAAWAQPAS
jgi:pimeloyl-ACP methyl ester carboxylesterase